MIQQWWRVMRHKVHKDHLLRLSRLRVSRIQGLLLSLALSIFFLDILVPRHEKIKSAFQIVRFIDKSVLVQLWIPKRVKDSVYILETSEDLPFGVTEITRELYFYRMVSLVKKLYVDVEKKVANGLSGSVFLKSHPEWTPNVQKYSTTKDPQFDDAVCYNVRGSVALPVFEEDCCIGVLELVTTIEKETFDHEIEEVCRALEAVNLKSSERKSCDCKANIQSEVSLVGSKKTRTTPSSKITYNDLARHFGMSRGVAAKKLGLQPSTFRNVCRDRNITWWPCLRRKYMKKATQESGSTISQSTSDQEKAQLAIELERIEIHLMQDTDEEENTDYQVSIDWEKCLINDLDPYMN